MRSEGVGVGVGGYRKGRGGGSQALPLHKKGVGAKAFFS